MKVSLSDSEWRLMDLIWASSPRTITELCREDTGWTKSTIITMLSRLEAKGAVKCEEGGRAKLYYPALLREDAAGAETASFLNRVYGGSLGLMVNNLVESRSLTEEDIRELSEILEKAREV